jgi:hypothetical protein
VLRYSAQNGDESFLRKYAKPGTAQNWEAREIEKRANLGSTRKVISQKAHETGKRIKPKACEKSFLGKRAKPKARETESARNREGHENSFLGKHAKPGSA